MFKAFISPRLDEVSYGFDVIFMLDNEVVSTMAFADRDTAELAQEKWEK